MSHDLYMEGGEAAMMYFGEEPWHELGTRLERPATAEEAIVAAKLDWEVKKLPIYAVGDNRQGCRIEGHSAMVPADRWGRPGCPVFGIVGDEYTPVQNREAFESFDAIVGEGAAVYHTAGALGKGERVWILAKLPDSIRVVGDDITDKCLLLSNTHDGTTGVQVKFTPIRVVCKNTLNQAIADGPRISVPHTRNVKRRGSKPLGGI